MRRSRFVLCESQFLTNNQLSYIVPGLGDFGDRFYTM
jgi:uracil phosphoribosyltransferase